MSGEEEAELTARTVGLVSWVKLFRRTVGFASQYPPGHAQRTAVVQELDDETQRYVGRWGKLELRFTPGHCESAEGFPLRVDPGAESGGYAFFPLFHDGVASLHLGPGVGLRDVKTLLAVVGANSADVVDDAFLRLWHAQNPSIQITPRPTVTTQAAGALAAADPNDGAAKAYTATLTAAAPFYTSGDLRPMFTTATLDGLVGHGIDAAASMEMLTTTDGAANSPRVRPDAASTLRSLFEHDGDRTARRTAIQRAQFHDEST